VADSALFERFPTLRGRIPHRPFLAGPTPVLRVAVAGAPELWVKRDDRCTPLYGGNKPRKLEFILGEAEARGARRVFTTGGIGTHHGLATTILARTCGMATTLVLVDQPVTDEVRESLRLFAAFGADVIDARRPIGAVALGVPALLRSRLRGERAYVVPTGGSGATGNLGFVSAALELAGQIKGGELPEPAAIFLPIGSGGSVAGVTLGLRLAGLATPVVGVLATDILPPSPARLARLARATLRTLRRADPSIPAHALRAADFDVAREQIGPGYGATTPAADAARAAARDAGLALETTYGAKCLAEIRARAAARTLPAGPVLFWHTFNAVDVAAQAPPPRTESLPPRLARFAAGA
jgi:D-cysteine desulfhydrase